MWRSWLARQIVALEAEGSNPFIHPILFFSLAFGGAEVLLAEHWDVAKR